MQAFVDIRDVTHVYRAAADGAPAVAVAMDAVTAMVERSTTGWAQGSQRAV